MAPGNKFACLTYHVIGDGTGQYTVNERQLRTHVALLKAENWISEGFEQLESRLRLGKGVPRCYVVVTVDDGHESSMRAADVFGEYGCQATFFLTRNRSLTKAGYIGVPQIRELRKRGFSLGTHGTTHRKLTFMSEQACLEELEGSKQWLEDVIGERVSYMAAPGGYINARILKLASQQGYTLTGTCNEWMNSPNAMSLPGEVNRVNIRRQFSVRTFRHILEGSRSFYLWRQARSAALAIPKQLLGRQSAKPTEPAATLHASGFELSSRKNGRYGRAD